MIAEKIFNWIDRLGNKIQKFSEKIEQKSQRYWKWEKK